jgi:dTDP-4-dehydrorhamnose reductase
MSKRMKAQLINDQPRQILLVGGDGLIGKALQRRWGAEKLLCTSRKLQTQSTGTLMWDLVQPMPNFSLQAGDVVLMAAALTSLEGCEKNRQLAHRVNVEAPAEVAGLCARKGARLTFLSSSAVFDGEKAFPSETDTPCPVTEYGRNKAEAERLIQTSGAKFMILRLTKVLSLSDGYLAGLMRALAQGQRVEASPDLPVAPLSLHWAVEAITRFLNFEESGIFHLSPKDDTNYYEMARKAAEMYGYPVSLIVKQKLAYMQKLLPQIPRNAALSPKKAVSQLGLAVPMWTAALEKEET